LLANAKELQIKKFAENNAIVIKACLLFFMEALSVETLPLCINSLNTEKTKAKKTARGGIPVEMMYIAWCALTPAIL
jgi:hypothetical protein